MFKSTNTDKVSVVNNGLFFYNKVENGKETKHGICSFNVQPQEDIPEFKGFVECLRQKYKDKKQAD